MKILKVDKQIKLPIEFLATDGVVEQIGFAGNENIYINNGYHLAFADMEGQANKTLSKKYSKRFVPDQNSVLTYQFVRKKSGDTHDCTYTYYDVSNGTLEQTGQTYTIESISRCTMHLSNQWNLFGVVAERGVFISRYTKTGWEELGKVKKKVLDTYKPDFVKFFFSEKQVIFAYERQPRVVFYDYEKQEQTNELALPFSSVIHELVVSHDEKFLLIRHETDTGQQQVSVYNIANQTIVFASAEGVKNFETSGDLLALVYQNHTIEIYHTSDFRILGGSNYFSTSIVNNIQFKFHESEPKLIATDSDVAVILSWEEKEVTPQYETKDNEGLTETFAGYCQKIESWDVQQIMEVQQEIKALGKRDKILMQRYIDYRYQDLVEMGIRGKNIKILANLPAKWDKMKNEKKVAVLKYWPKDIPFFTHKLDLSASLRVDRWRDSHYKNQIDELPEEIGQIKGVMELDLTHQQLPKLPETLYDMTDLEVLKLEDNKLKELPEELLNLSMLRVLILKQNYGLESIPDLGHLLELEEVDFEYTDIKSLPDSFFALKNIKEVNTMQSDLDKNTAIMKRMLAAFPDARISTYAHEAIELEENENLDEYKGQESITIDSFQLNYLSAGVFEADVVKKLVINTYHLKELPDLFGGLLTLEELSIKTGSDVKILPASITQLLGLKELSLEGQFTKLPADIGKLSNLETIYLRSHELKELPESFALLQNLQSLTTEYWNTTVLSSAIGSLKSLKTIKLANTSASKEPLQIDESFGQMEHLEAIEIELRSGDLNETIFNLPKSIKRLDLSVSRYMRNEKFSTEISFAHLVNHFENLESLWLEGVKLKKEKKKIKPHKFLREMVFRSAMWQHLPDDIAQLENLQDVTLFEPRLKEFNPAIYQCPALKSLRISNLKLTTIPVGIAQMTTLEELGFEYSDISSLPNDIFELPNFKRLVLDNCPLFSNKSFKAKIKRKIKGVKVGKSWY